MNPQWVELAGSHPHRRVILDNSSESPVHGQQEGPATTGTSSVSAYYPLLFARLGQRERRYEETVHQVPWRQELPTSRPERIPEGTAVDWG